jgi:hypothetical protein
MGSGDANPSWMEELSVFRDKSLVGLSSVEIASDFI